MSKFGDLIGGKEGTSTRCSTPPAPVAAPTPAAEPAFGDMSKLELEAVGRTMGIELDRRKSKKKLIQELKDAGEPILKHPLSTSRGAFSCIISSVQTKQMSLSKENIVECLRESYGESVTSADIKAWCAMNDFNYQTVTNKLTDYKTGRGRWNLTVTEQLEQTYQAPAALPAIEQNLIPEKDDSFVKFGNFGDLKKIYSVPSLLPYVYHGSLRQW